MIDDTWNSVSQFSGIGGIAVISGIVCCIGLKLVGGAVLFGGVATMIGITTDQATFLLGGIAGVLVAAILFMYRGIAVGID